MNALFMAMNDWPIPVDTPEEYESEVSRFIGGGVTEENISKTLDTIDFSKYAWQAESMAELTSVFEFYDKGTSLEEIIANLPNEPED